MNTVNPDKWGNCNPLAKNSEYWCRSESMLGHETNDANLWGGTLVKAQN